MKVDSSVDCLPAYDTDPKKYDYGYYQEDIDGDGVAEHLGCFFNHTPEGTLVYLKTFSKYSLMHGVTLEFTSGKNLGCQVYPEFVDIMGERVVKLDSCVFPTQFSRCGTPLYSWLYKEVPLPPSDEGKTFLRFKVAKVVSSTFWVDGRLVVLIIPNLNGKSVETLLTSVFECKAEKYRFYCNLKNSPDWRYLYIGILRENDTLVWHSISLDISRYARYFWRYVGIAFISIPIDGKACETCSGWCDNEAIYLKDISVLFGVCEKTSDCRSNQYCGKDDICRYKKRVGSSCSSNEESLSGLCKDNKCACTSQKDCSGFCNLNTHKCEAKNIWKHMC
jgi:hypothetical protein